MTRLARARQLAAAMKLHRSRRALEFGPREELLRFQRARFAQTVRYAVARSPFYRELYAGVDLTEPAALPTVTKAQLVDRFDDWVTDERLRGAGLDAHVESLTDKDVLFKDTFRIMPSGGTSGRRALHAFDRGEWTECLAAFMRWSDLMGLRPKVPRLRVASIMSPGARHMTARFNLSIDVGAHRTLRLDAGRSVAEQRAELEAFRPDALIGYASAIGLLACDQLDGHLAIRPRIVATTSEVRTDETLERIRAAWNVEPFDVFGSTETLYGGDCEQHAGIHAFDDQCLVEVVGGRLVVTSFIRRTQPLIRYELGDLAELNTEPCACGRSLARIGAIAGRADDVLDLPATGGGTVAVHPIAIRSPLSAVPELRRYKVINERDGMRVLVELREGGDAVAQRVAVVLRDGLAKAGADVQPRVEVVDTLADSSASGKFRLIESRGA
jgi:phenylacetate-coenzyme A ligase PaaK-like adenylate-forming protein